MIDRKGSRNVKKERKFLLINNFGKTPGPRQYIRPERFQLIYLFRTGVTRLIVKSPSVCPFFHFSKRKLRISHI